MCRLFGMAAGREPVKATFWLLEAPDSLAEQSRRNPDGYGLATYVCNGRPEVQVEKRPVAAYRDEEFARQANERESPLFMAHVRYASTGTLGLKNTHPFEQEGRVFAHNGHLEGLDALEEQLGHAVDVGNFLRLAWLVSSLATIGGALGSFVESDFAVREATYRYQPDEGDELD